MGGNSESALWGTIAMTDNVAVLDGYTQERRVTVGRRVFPILMKPCTDMSVPFRAWDMDRQEFIVCDGWPGTRMASPSSPAIEEGKKRP